jgi:hypothetical protein
LGTTAIPPPLIFSPSTFRVKSRISWSKYIMKLTYRKPIYIAFMNNIIDDKIFQILKSQ